MSADDHGSRCTSRLRSQSLSLQFANKRVAIDEDTLSEIAKNGEMDYAKWPAIIEPLLDRLNHIVYTDFPTSRPYTTVIPNASASSDPAQHSMVQSGATLVSQTPTTPRTLPPVPPFPGSASSISHVPNSQPEASQSANTTENDTKSTPELPLILAQLLASIASTLRTSFVSKPPHTLQRLAELILHPNNHYRTLPAYLRALDRVVSVSSTADIFPLSEQPNLVNGITNGESGGGILWKNEANGLEKSRDNDLGSDESLGGALLTPIPWLRDVHSYESKESDSSGASADADGDLLEPLNHPASTTLGSNTDSNDAGDSSATTHVVTALATPYHDPLVPERHDGAVTQGELIRMEQEAGVVPVTHSSQSNPIRSAGRTEPVPNSIALGVGVGLDDLEDEVEGLEGRPHARGPDMVGTVDMGLVGGRDIQVSIGSPPIEGNRERIPTVDVNDAQDVLAGSGTNATVNKRPDSASDESYVDVGRDMDDIDAMQIDSMEDGTDNIGETNEPTRQHDDDDIVLVDADGLTESERKDVDDIGG